MVTGLICLAVSIGFFALSYRTGKVLWRGGGWSRGDHPVIYRSVMAFYALGAIIGLILITQSIAA